MTILELLSEKGFSESVDFTFFNGILDPVAKTRPVTIQISPPEYNQFGVEITPATFSHTTETYYEVLPNLRDLKAELISKEDTSLIFEQILSDKKDQITENDSLNIDLFLAGGNGFRFKNISTPTIDQLFDLINVARVAGLALSQKQEKIEAGKKAREICQQVLDLIAGYNLDRELTIQQITQLQSTLSAPEAALRAGRPALSKQLISAVQPDGNLVTQEMKEVALNLLSDY